MSTAAGPDGADEGLTFSVDFANPRSYAGSGTTVNSIVNASNTGTINNGASFTTLNGGYLTLDGTDDYIIFNNPDTLKTSSMSISAWINLTNNSGYADGAVIAGFTDGTNWRYGMSLSVYGGSVSSSCGNGTNTYSATSAIGMGNWAHVCGTYDASTLVLRLYINGVLVTTTTSAYLTHNATNNLVIGHGIGYTSYLATRIGSVQIFNKALSALEILQNYIATKPRFAVPPIITEGLVLNLDAGNTLSYSGSGTTWTDISGYGNNATLVNGPTYSAANSGYITFDGANDYADFYAPNLTTTATVEMWCNITAGYPNKMFMGWNDYDIYCGGGSIGYNTGAGDVYGISSATVSSLGCVGNWKQYIFEFRSDVSYTNNKIYVNTTSQSLSQISSSENAGSRNFNSGFGRIALWRANTGYEMPMNCAIFRVYNRSLSAAEIYQNFNAYRTRFGV